MFKYQFLFPETGEITESSYKYKSPETACRGARAFMKEVIKYGERRKDEEARLKIIEEGGKLKIDSGKASVESILSWLTGYRVP